MFKGLAWLALLIACIVCVVCVSVTVAIPAAIAQDSPGDQSSASKVVRVGWYESAFHSTDQFGRRSGYGYEYQQRIATYTGWTYEYVEGSWSELFEKLDTGRD